MSSIEVRSAEPSDLGTIVDFNQRLARETEGKELTAEILTRGVQRMLEDRSKGQYFVAESTDHDGRVVGQLMFTREWSDWRNGDILWIQSVYVESEFRRQGVFRMLLNRLQQVVNGDPDVVGLRLYVEHENSRAQETYRNLGFSTPGYFVMESIAD